MTSTSRRPGRKTARRKAARKMQPRKPAPPKTQPNGWPRDTQRSRVYRAEKMTEHLLVGQPWMDLLEQDEVVALVDHLLQDPVIVSRWGQKKAIIAFSRRGQYAWSERANGKMHFARGASNPLTVIHEVAHLLATKETEAPHGPGFAAIYRYLVTHFMGEQAVRILDACFTTLGVETDDTRIPKVRRRPGVPTASKWEVPGVLSGQMSRAAEILRTARDSGLFDDDPGLRASATRLARRLDTAEKHVPSERAASPILPANVTINVGALLKANSRDDVAEIVLATVRNHLTPKPLKPGPLDPRDPKGKKRKKQQTLERQKAAAKRLAAGKPPKKA